MITLGLTGSFGSGKTTVAAMFARLGARIIDADAISRQALEPDGPAYRKVIEEFGEKILRLDGRIDRAALAHDVFGDAEQRKRLEAIVHPAVRAEERRQAAQAGPGEVVVFDVPLLFETGMDRECDRTCVVTVSEPEREARLAAHGHKPGDVRARLAAQMPQEEKARRADYTVDNSGNLDATLEQVRRLMKELKSQAEAASHPPKEQGS